MAIGATAVWECVTTGSDDNGGFYTTGGTDYSQQDAAQLTLADIVADGTTTLTSVTGGFTSAMIGNGIHLDTPDEYYEVATYVDGNEITVDRIVAANVGIAGKVGGAVATIAEVAAVAVASNKIWVKGNRTISVQISPTNSGGVDIQTVYEGYGTTRGDDTKVVLTANGVVRIIYLNVAYNIWRNFDLSGGSSETIYFGATGDYTQVEQCIFRDSVDGINIPNTATACKIIDCEIHSNSSEGIYGFGPYTRIIGCYIHNNTGYAIRIDGVGSLIMDCIIEDNSSTGIWLGGAYIHIINNTIDGNGTGARGIDMNAAVATVIMGNLFTNYSTAGNYAIYRDSAGTGHCYVNYNAYYNNDTDVKDMRKGVNAVNLSGDPYTNYAGHDFSLNSSAGAGGACRSANVNSGGGQGNYGTNYMDIGALQAEPSAGASGGSFGYGG